MNITDPSGLLKLEEFSIYSMAKHIALIIHPERDEAYIVISDDSDKKNDIFQTIYIQKELALKARDSLQLSITVTNHTPNTLPIAWTDGGYADVYDVERRDYRVLPCRL